MPKGLNDILKVLCVLTITLITCILYFIFIDYRKSTPFILSMAFGRGCLTGALVVWSLKKFSHPGTLDITAIDTEVLASTTLFLSLLLLVARMASLEGARRYQMRSLGTEVAAFLLLYFRFVHFKSLLIDVWERVRARRNARKNETVECTKQGFPVVTRSVQENN